MRPYILIPIGFALALAACGGNNGYFGPVTPAPTTPCVAPVTIQVLYPQPGATAVPAASTTAIYVATSAAFPSNSSNDWDTELVGPPNYGAQFTGTFTATTAASLPAGSATATISNPQYFSTSIPANPPLPTGGAAFSIYINNLNDATCYAVGSGATAVATFSTQ